MTDEAARRASQNKFLQSAALDLRLAAPANADEVGIAIKRAGQLEQAAVRGYYLGAVRLRLAPIGSAHVDRSIREAECNREAARFYQRRIEQDRNRIQFGMATGEDPYRNALCFKVAVENAIPEIQLLMNAADGFQPQRLLIEQQGDLGEIQPVRIFAQPVIEGRLPFSLSCISDRAAVCVVHLQAKIGGM